MQFLTRIPIQAGVSCKSRVWKCVKYYPFLQAKRFVFWGTSKANDWNKAVSDAEKIVGYPTSFMSLRCLLSDELSNVAMHTRKLVGTKHPLLKTARGLLLDGKHSLQTRGLIVLLVSKAAGPSSVLDDDQDMVSGIYPRQRNLAEITEMIHTANLIHKGVVNLSDLVEADGSLQDMAFGNKMSILSGDFLLANACTGLAQLQNTKVVEIISSAIGDLMEAEFTEMKDSDGLPVLPTSVKFSHWLQQTFLSSGSLLAKSCLSAVTLANHNEEVQEAAYSFGENMSYAHQLSEDLKPFLRPDSDLQDFSLTSAPVIQYAQSFGTTTTFSLMDMDLKQLLNGVLSGHAVEECRSLCNEYAEKSLQSLDIFIDSDAKQALVNIVKATTQL
ncbi:hypothetical protein ScPMuIL_012490 [Solemya velum]